jgi:Bacterial SH3 domain
MIRQAAAVVVALCLSTSPLYAQSTPVKLTVSDASATVHKAPSVGSPVIGKAPRGTALVVTREVGDWVKVSWPSAVDGAGYVRMNAGTIARGNAAAPAGAKAAATPAPVGSKTAVAATPAPAPIAATTAQVPTTRPSAPSPARTLYVAPTHIFGIGAVVGGSTMGFGASARAWKKDRIGLQLEVSRYSFDSVDLLSRATSTDIAPSLLFAMNDRVTDYLWLRPYLGVAGHLVHSSRTDLIFTDVTESANTFGVRGFVGAEMSFSSLPQFALSADVGYYHLPEPFVGFEPGGMGFAISGHWYVK